MENKMYELMEKMYQELQETKIELKGDINELKGGINKLNGDIDGLKSNVNVLKDDVKKMDTKLENETNDKVRALFDDREIQKEINAKIISTLDRIEAKVDVLQLETAHIHRIK